MNEQTAEIDRSRSIVTVPRVLIVEDEADLRLLLAYSL